MKTKKAMKKITIIGMAALVAMGMLGTSCNKVESQEMETPETPKDNIVTLTTTVGFAADDTKALTIDYTNKKLTKTFKAGEQVVLTYEDQDGNNQNTVSQALTPEDISADGKSAKLTFSLTNPKADGSITYKYPASMLEDNGHVKTSYFFAQNGTLTDVATRDYATYSSTLAGTNLPSATLDNELAVVAFTLYKSDGTTDITNTITGMTIEVGGVTYTITPSGLDKIYVAMWPEGGSEIITITATDGSKNYTKTLTGKTYAANNFYQQGLKMVAAEPEGLAAPLTVEALTAGTVKVNINGTLSTGMKYSVNGGAKTLITTSTDIPVSAGDKVRFYGNGTATQVYGDSPEVKILGDGADFTCKAYGNIMSLLDEENFATKTDLPNQNYVFYGLFYGNTALTDASTLLLPATTLAYSCYNSMFRDCKALTAAPALPATTLAETCYYQMFNGCSVLTAAPALPATTLFTSCYYEMFNGCSALTAAPALPATTLVQTCYDRMFNGCSNLSSVTCLATEGINQNNNSTYDWLDGVAASGTFTAATDAIWPEGVNDGIPSGWTRKNPDGSAYRPLADATADDKGKIAGADGQIYDTKADATAAGTTAVAMIIYVGSETDNTTYTHGLALALADESYNNMSWSTAKSTCEGKTAVSGAVWLLPSRNQWDTMISAAGSDTALRDGFSSVGGTNLREVNYWSSTKSGDFTVWAYYFSSSKWFALEIPGDWGYVRACLAF